eukprot:3528250-Rhodomonas_salina.1
MHEPAISVLFVPVMRFLVFYFGVCAICVAVGCCPDTSPAAWAAGLASGQCCLCSRFERQGFSCSLPGGKLT